MSEDWDDSTAYRGLSLYSADPSSMLAPHMVPRARSSDLWAQSLKKGLSTAGCSPPHPMKGSGIFMFSYMRPWIFKLIDINGCACVPYVCTYINICACCISIWESARVAETESMQWSEFGHMCRPTASFQSRETSYLLRAWPLTPTQQFYLSVSELDQWLQTPLLQNSWRQSPNLYFTPDYSDNFIYGRISAVRKLWALLFAANIGRMCLYPVSFNVLALSNQRLEECRFPLPSLPYPAGLNLLS